MRAHWCGRRLAGVMAILGIVLVGVGLAPQRASAHADERAAGAEVFASSGCTHCHGAEGQGGELGPSLRGLRKKLPADKVEAQIVHGGGGMPAFGEILGDEKVKELVVFLRAKTWIAAPAKPEAAPAPAPNTAGGGV